MGCPCLATHSLIAVAWLENSCVIYNKICCSLSNQTRVKHYKKPKQLLYCPHFLLAAKKNTILVSFWWDSSVSTAACTAGTATVGALFAVFFLSIFELGGVTKHLMAAP